MITKNSNSESLGAVAPRILLTTTNRWPLAARLAISLAQAGCEVAVICPSRHPIGKARAIRRVFRYSGLRPLPALLAAIEAMKPQIVVPCDDRGVQHLHELHARALHLGDGGRSLAALIERSLGSPASYPVASDRYDFLKIAREEGLRIPDTDRVNAPEDLDSWRGRPLPWVLKADGTWGGGGVKIASTAPQAEQFFGDLKRLFGLGRVLRKLIVNRDTFWIRSWWNRCQPAVSIQSHVQGHPANYSALCWGGKLLAGIGVEVVSTEGLTGPATIVRVVDHPEMQICAERIARRLSLSGFFGLDFMIEQTTGAPYLIELNPRCTPPCYLNLGEGRDLVGALQAQLSGQRLRESSPVTQNELIGYFPQARNSGNELAQSCFEDLPQGEPEFVREILSPWPERTLLFRLAQRLNRKPVAAEDVIPTRPAELAKSIQKLPSPELDKAPQPKERQGVATLD